MEHIASVLDSLSGFIRPITSNLPKPVEDLGIFLLDSEQCYNTLVRNADFVSSPECLSLGISKGLSWGIVGMSSIVKIPQILKLINSQSAEGISSSGYILETLSYVITIAYNFRSQFPFSTFGETVLITVQNIIVTALLFLYSGKALYSALFVALISAAFTVLIDNSEGGLVNHQILSYLQASTIFLNLFSKVPQVYSNWVNKSTGALSAFAVFNYLLGSLARVYTTMKEVDDPIILASFLGSTILNFILALQVVQYWNAKAPNRKVAKKD
jgi:mannose-P-dolichol utilization defect 1